jgi:Protein of unknown function (DUF1194)
MPILIAKANKAAWMAAALTAVLAIPLCASTGSDQVDVALVLAIDVSSSVDDRRFALQRRGIADALESEEVATAVSSGVNQAIEIAVVEWAEEQRLLVPWTVIRGRDDLETLATRLRRAVRSWVRTKTDPGGGIAAAEHLFGELPVAGIRQIIDVSGDGRQNTGEVATTEARDAAISRGLTVNGLPIAGADEPEIEDWYRANGGPERARLQCSRRPGLAACRRGVSMMWCRLWGCLGSASRRSPRSERI